MDGGFRSVVKGPFSLNSRGSTVSTDREFNETGALCRPKGAVHSIPYDLPARLSNYLTTAAREMVPVGAPVSQRIASGVGVWR